MKILIAPDKFKGSLSAQQVCEAISNGLKKCKKNIEVIFHPMADGGDGSLEVLANHMELKEHSVITTDPLGRKIFAQYFTSSDAALIELASASGIVLLSENERNPLLTTTFGTGKMMADAISKGYHHIYLFLGGSATNEAGMGIATALGCQFLDKNNKPLAPIGRNLPKVRSIKTSRLYDFQKIKMTLLCDVINPLYGPRGAAHVYARQKGASDEQVAILDKGLRHFSSILHQQLGMEVSGLPGSGAAGGIGAGLVALFGAKLESGFTTLSKLTGLEKQIQAADWVISGEGKLDGQSLRGKVVSGVAALCKKHQKPLTLFVGKNDLSQKEIDELGIEYIFSVIEIANNMQDALSNGAYYLEKLASGFSKQL